MAHTNTVECLGEYQFAISTNLRQQFNIPIVADSSAFPHEPLVLTQSHMQARNFGVDAAGGPAILDF